MAGRLKPAAARAHIASGALEPLYLVLGDDQAEKLAIVAAFDESVDPDLRVFNVERLYGGEIQVHALLDSARILPLGAHRRIIIVLQADRLFVPRRQSEQAERDLEALEAYVRAPDPGAAMVFVADAFDRRRKLSKALLQHAVVIECGTLGDPNEAIQWIRARVAEQSMNIEPAAARLLVERAGLDAPRLRAEVERACLFAAGRKTVTVADVSEVAGAETAQGGWALVNAMQDGAAAQALRELALVLEQGGVPLLILGQIRSYVERAHLIQRDAAGRRSSRPPMSVEQQRRAFDALLRTDLALKTMGRRDPRDEQVLLERLIVELCESAGERAGGPDGRS